MKNNYKLSDSDKVLVIGIYQIFMNGKAVMGKANTFEII